MSCSHASPCGGCEDCNYGIAPREGAREKLDLKPPFTRRAARVLRGPAGCKPESLTEVMVFEPGEQMYDPLPGYSDAFHCRGMWRIVRSVTAVCLSMPQVDTPSGGVNFSDEGELIVVWEERKGGELGVGSLLAGIHVSGPWRFEVNYSSTIAACVGNFDAYYTTFRELTPFLVGTDDYPPPPEIEPVDFSGVKDGFFADAEAVTDAPHARGPRIRVRGECVNEIDRDGVAWVEIERPGEFIRSSPRQ
jgi:hypothetical protein